MSQETTGLEIAVIGMAGRFPGAMNVEQFWRNVRQGTESVRTFSEEELRAAGVPQDLLRNPSYVSAFASLAEIELFDAEFFGYSPREAELMDPQQRIFLQTAWAGLEDAGYDPARYAKPVGVFAGCSDNSYAQRIYSRSEWTRRFDPMQVFMGNNRDFLTTRVSFQLNLTGPSVLVQTACSTSLVAVHLASQSLLSGECEMALAGGSAIRLPQDQGYLHQQGGIRSSDGHCRPFDAEASGTVGGNGVAVVVLKRLEDALADGDAIRAVIKGTAINNDGSYKVGFTAPAVEGQASVIRAAQAAAGIDPETVSYLEAHGTGTALGDPVEMEALTQAFGGETAKRGFCSVGSLKSNMGHLDAAAGVAGLIKTILALQYREIPPLLHFKKVNPRIDLEKSPFRIAGSDHGWKAPFRRAGVSSFGIGGTNAHVVVEEAPPEAETEAEAEMRPQIFVLSAKTETALAKMGTHLAEHLRERPDLNLADIAFTLQEGRQPFAHRAAAVCVDSREAVQKLESIGMSGVARTECEPGASAGVALMFSGQGSQYVNMGWGLMEEPVFRREVEACCEFLKDAMGMDPREALFAPNASGKAGWVDETRWAQPCLFVVEYALATFLLSLGIKPEAMIGHSIGEYVAACLSGVMSRDEALRLVAVRGALMQGMPEGSMVAVGLPEEEVREWLSERVSLAAVNASNTTVLSGETGAVDEVAAKLEQRGVMVRRLRTSHAFHSHMMEPILAEFEKEVRRVRLSTPKLPFVSNVTGTWITPEEATDPGYWVRHLRETVRFSQGIEELAKRESRILVEVGPGEALVSLAKRHLPREKSSRTFALIRHPKEEAGDLSFLYGGVARLWCHGVAVDWAQVRGDSPRRRVPLPTYPFEGKRYWIESAGPETPAIRSEGKKEDPADWFYVPAWETAPLLAGKEGETEEVIWLILGDTRLAPELKALLEQTGEKAVFVSPGSDFSLLEPGHYQVRPEERKDFVALVEALKKDGCLPDRVVHLWGVEVRESTGAEEARALVFYSLLYLTQVLAGAGGDRAVRLATVSDRLHRVLGNEDCEPRQALALGLVNVIPAELEKWQTQAIDLNLEEEGGLSRKAGQIYLEFQRETVEESVAFRERQRWAQTYAPVRLPGKETLPFKEEGVYLVTGGLGGIGLRLAEYLAVEYRAKVVLVGRSEFPGDGQGAETDNALSRKLKRIEAMERGGGRVLVLRADVAEKEEVERVVEETVRTFGHIHGVIHSAGVAGGGLIRNQNVDSAERVFAAKVTGTEVLIEALSDQPLDFCLLCSSLSSVLGGVGRAEYAAANAFLDAFASAQHCNGNPVFRSILWDRWSESGMAVAFEQSHGRRGPGGSLLKGGLSDDEGVEAFKRVMAQQLPVALVSTEDFAVLRRRVRQGVSEGEDDSVKTDVTEGRSRQERSKLSSAHVPASSEAEKILAAIWEEALGIEGIGVEDNFFELGGDSLLGVLIANRAKSAGILFNPNDLFTHQSIAELAKWTEQDREAGEDEAGERPGFPGLELSDRELEKIASLGPEGSRVEDVYPLSSLQRGIFLHSDEPGMYWMQHAVELEGTLQVETFREAWQRAFEANAVLRTCFYWSEREDPLQVVFSGVPLPWEYADWSQEEAWRTKLDAYLLEDAARGVSLNETPLMRVSLIRTGAGTHILIFRFHHILLDGWSVPLLFEQVFKAYRALLDGKLCELASRVKYRDYIDWLRHTDEASAEKAWRRELKGFTTPTALPMVGNFAPEDAGEARRFGSHTVRLSEETTRGLERFARNQRLTMNTLVQGAWAILLSLYSREEDVVFGWVSSGRSAGIDGIETLQGLLMNTLATRVKVDGEKALAEWLREHQSKQAELRRYEHAPVSNVREWSELPAGTPLFETVAAFERFPVGGEKDGDWLGFAIRELTVVEPTSYPLAVIATCKDRFNVRASFDQRRIRRADVERLLGHLGTILEQFVSCPETKVSGLGMVSKQEREQIMTLWNPAPRPYPSGKGVAGLFELQAARDPGAIAVTDRKAARTYGELNEQANRVAWMLIESGVEPGSMVGFCLERSADLVAVMLGILKAGAAYVPFDPTYPEDRLHFMAQDTGTPVMITEKANKERLRSVGARVICLDEEEGFLAERGRTNPGIARGGDDLAYVMYSSGSTGKPKGILIPHRGIIRLAVNTDYIQLTAEDVVAQTANASFDASTFEIWGPLLNGGSAVIIDKDAFITPETYVSLLRDKGVTVAFVTTALFNETVRQIPDAFRTLKTVMFGGEQADPATVGMALREGAPERLLHVYGPTEATTFSHWHPVRHVPEGAKIVPIGKPIGNTRGYILDRFGNLAPVGVPGELCLSGDGLATGYHNRADLTGEKFITNAFEEDPCARMYRTGDLVRFSAEGDIEFLGRIDHQVKIRGFRIEPGEIELLLNENPEVKDNVVVAAQDPHTGGRMLAAYVVFESGAVRDLSAIRARLSAKVPDYMVPSVFMVMEVLPLGPNGKVDRKKLPAPEWDREKNGQGTVLEGELEKRVAAIWEEILELEEVGAEENFFELGGNSLLLARVHKRLVEQGHRIGVLDLFQNATVRSIAAFCRNNGAEESKEAFEDLEKRETSRHARLRGMRMGQLES